MTKKQYEAKRNELMNEAQNLINEGKANEAQEKMNEVKALDEKWDAIATAQANFDAMNKEPQPVNLFGNPETFMNMGEIGADSGEENEVVKAWKSNEYKNAWAKMLMNKKMSASEQTAFQMVNEAYTHTTKNTGIVIPETVAKGIWEFAGEIYPYFEDISKTYVNGVLTMIQEEESSDASWYEEDTKTEDGKETFKEYQLSGCELARDITVSWKLKEMAIEDFIPYIQRKMAKKMGKAAGYGVTHGKGSTAVAGKPEPTGVVTALLAEEEKPQVVEYAAGGLPTWENITTARSKVKSGYGTGLRVYANSNTIWTKIANILDANKRPIFAVDANGKCRVLGLEVKEDDSMNDGEILFSNPSEGYHMNINKEMTVMTEEHVKDRKTDYCGYAIMDGNVVTTKAHALLTEAAAEQMEDQAEV